MVSRRREFIHSVAGLSTLGLASRSGRGATDCGEPDLEAGSDKVGQTVTFTGEVTWVGDFAFKVGIWNVEVRDHNSRSFQNLQDGDCVTVRATWAQNSQSGDFYLRDGEILSTSGHQTATPEAPSPLSASDVEIEFENNFRGERAESFLPKVFDTVSRALPTSNPSVPDENEAYIHVDMRIRFADRVADSVSEVRPVLTHDQTERTFTLSNAENFLSDAEYDGDYEVEAVSPGVYGVDNLRIRTPTQVGLNVVASALTVLSAGMSHGEVTSPLEAKTEAYPDVYVTELVVENTAGLTTRLDVERRIPRYDDVCSPAQITQMVNPDCPVEKTTANYGSGTMVFSPATVAAVDAEGRVTGRVREGGEYVVYDEIQGATYSGPARHEFVFVPEGDHRYIVDGQAEGTATVRTDRMDDGMVYSETYSDVAVDGTTRLERSLDSDVLEVERGVEATGTTEIRPDESVSQPPSQLLQSRLSTGSAQDTGGFVTTDSGSGSALPYGGWGVGSLVVGLGLYRYLSGSDSSEERPPQQ